MTSCAGGHSLVCYSSSDDESLDDNPSGKKCTASISNSEGVNSRDASAVPVNALTLSMPAPLSLISRSDVVRHGASDTHADTQTRPLQTKSGSDASRSRNQLLAVPAGVINMFAETNGHTDMRGHHQGRIRTFAHEDGNWATTIYVSVNETENFMKLAGLWEACLQSSADFYCVDHFHLSLSRTFAVQFHLIGPLVDSLRLKLATLSSIACSFNGIQFYNSDEKTRTFVALQLEMGVTQLQLLVNCIDEVLDGFKLIQYYKPASFHVSILWALGDQQNTVSTTTKHNLQHITDCFLADNPHTSVLNIDKVTCRSGNKLFTISLRDST